MADCQHLIYHLVNHFIVIQVEGNRSLLHEERHFLFFLMHPYIFMYWYVIVSNLNEICVT